MEHEEKYIKLGSKLVRLLTLNDFYREDFIKEIYCGVIL